MNEQCNWQLLSLSSVLDRPWDSALRPTVQKVFSHGSDTTPGQVLPVVSPSTEFVETGMGPMHKTTKAKLDFVFTLGFAAEDAKVTSTEVQDAVLEKMAKILSRSKRIAH